MGKHFRHLSWNDRLTIERMEKAGFSIADIAKATGYCRQTIYRELKRGTYMRRNSDFTEEVCYSPDIAQDRYRKHLLQKGRELKVGNDYEYVRFIEHKVIQEKKSPYAARIDIKKERPDIKTDVCLSTLYNYIRRGDVFLNLEISDCPMPRKAVAGRMHRVQARAARGTSIEKRPAEINECKTVGHWEGDTVVGNPEECRSCLLVFTERRSLYERIVLLREHTGAAVCKALDRIERELGEKTFRETWRSITCDNGPELSDWEGMEKSRRGKRKRTKIYRCHPYSSYERGRNENANRMIRRWFPKGTNFDRITKKQVKEVEEWLNNYPRPQFGGLSAKAVYMALQDHPPEDTAL